MDPNKEHSRGTPAASLMVPVDFNHSKPIYLQIVDHITMLARGGQLEAGAILPPSRTLAEQLQVHRSTVINAYDELKARGVIGARQGSGSYVADGLRDKALEYRPPRTVEVSQSEDLVAELWRLSRAEGVISLSLGLPAVELMPADEFDQVRRRVLRRDGAKAVEYEDPQGFYPLRRAIAADLARHGIITTAEDIIITWGAQESLSLVARTLAVAGDSAISEAPAFFGTLLNIHHLGIHLQTFSLTDQGPEWSTLMQAAGGSSSELGNDLIVSSRERPRFVSVSPDHQNPTGIRWSMPERHEFLKFAKAQDLIVVEDATYRDLTFDGPPHLPLRALDPEVIYAGTFSKSLMPGLRIGYVVANGRLRDHLITLKITTSGSGETLGQRALAEYLVTGRYTAHLKRINATYQARRDAMLTALEEFFPLETRWNRPTGGFYVWVTVPESVSVKVVFERALKRGIVIAPGAAFYPYIPQANGFRLCYSRHHEDMLTHAIRDLGGLLKSMLTSKAS